MRKVLAILLILCTHGMGQISRVDLTSNVKGILPAANGGTPVTEVEVTADWANSTTTASNITGMNWTVAASTVTTFECWWIVDTASTAIGLQVGWTGPTSPTMVVIAHEMATSTTADTARTTKTLSAFSTFTTSTTSPGTTKQLWYINGIVNNGTTAGTIQAQGKSSSSGSAVNIRKGSLCRVH